MSGSTDWLSAIGILLSGLVLGFMFIYAQLRRKSTTPAAVDQELLDLEARRDALVLQLREMDEGITSGDERRALELRTAEVLKAIDARSGVRAATRKAAAQTAASTPAVVSAPGTGFFAKHPAVKGFLWGVASIGGLALIGVYVYKSSTNKTPDAAQAMGSAQSSDTTSTDPHRQPPSADPAVQQLEAAVNSDPENVDRRIELARAYLDRENMMGVFEQTKFVLARHPDEPRAQTYNAIVKMAMGQTDEAKSMLEAATRKDPTLVDAWVATAWIQTQKGEKAKAQAAINAAIRNSPQNEARLKEVWAQMSSQPASPNAGMAGDHPPVAAAQAPAVDPASAIHLTLLLDNAAKAKSGIVYVVARLAGQTSGAPIAVKRLNATVFPMAFDLSSADSMMGQPLPARVSIEARLDTDGDAATRGAGDPTAFADNISSGIKLAMTLK